MLFFKKNRYIDDELYKWLFIFDSFFGMID